MCKKITILGLISLIFTFIIINSIQKSNADFDYTPLPDVEALYSNVSEGQTLPLWIFFLDRGLNPQQLQDALASAKSALPERTWHRRIKGGKLEMEEKDLPVNSDYIQAVLATGARWRTNTRYFNGISIDATYEQAIAIASFPFVKTIRAVARGYRIEPIAKNTSNNYSVNYNYGASYNQLQQINVPIMHEMGFTGQGVLVCLLDTGYNLEHIAFAQMDILATWDFINNDSVVTNQPGDPPAQDDHGTYTLSACGGAVDGELYGPAFEATFMAGKTEISNDEIPIEEDYYVAGLEWADSLGADVVSTSLGYIDWYTWPDMDGNTAVTTIGVDIAVANGMVCCTANGNERQTAWGHVIAPADADSVIAVGAVDAMGQIASFSSPGPTYDGRTKPEVCAMGVQTRCANPNNITGFTNVGGTSLSTPLVGGAAALIVQAHPNWPPMTVRNALMMTASNSNHPNNDYGWGIINTLAAVEYSAYPNITAFSPDSNIVYAYVDSTVTFSVTAEDEDGDPLTYLFLLNTEPFYENETGAFDFVCLEAGAYNISIIARDLIFFADSVSWTLIAQEFNAVVSNGTLPQDFSMKAYPNPFNSTLTIRFEMRDASEIDLRIYDIAGREVWALGIGHWALGEHSVVWNAEGLPSGIYFARLTAGQFAQTQKLLLIR